MSSNLWHTLVVYCLKLNVGTLHITEFLAVIAAVRHFRYHLLAAIFRLRTDHLPLQFVTNAKDPWRRRARWIAELQQYDFKMELIDGHNNFCSRQSKSPGVWKCQTDSFDWTADILATESVL